MGEPVVHRLMPLTEVASIQGRVGAVAECACGAVLRLFTDREPIWDDPAAMAAAAEMHHADHLETVDGRAIRISRPSAAKVCSTTERVEPPAGEAGRGL